PIVRDPISGIPLPIFPRPVIISVDNPAWLEVLTDVEAFKNTAAPGIEQGLPLKSHQEQLTSGSRKGSNSIVYLLHDNEADLERYLEEQYGPEKDEEGNIDYHNLFDDRESASLSWRTYLREMLTPYLTEFPFMRHDIETLRQLDKQLQTPIEIPKMY